MITVLFELIHYTIFAVIRFERIKPSVAHRKSKLEESLEYHQFLFDANSEIQWIKEHIPAAASTDYGKSLVDVQKLHKKHQVSISSLLTSA